MKRKYSWQTVVIFLLGAFILMLSCPAWLGLVIVCALIHWDHHLLVIGFVVLWLGRGFIQAVCLELIGKIMFK